MKTTRAAFGLAAFLLLFGVADAGQRTENLWKDIFRKYAGESLVCLQDKLVVDAEYTGDVQRRDVSDTERGGLQSDRSAELALGSKYTTINRYTKKYAILDEAGAARMREYVIPYWAGQAIAHHSAEVVDGDGKRVEMPQGHIEVRTAYPDQGEIYHRVKDLVFKFEGVPVPSVVIMNYTIEGEEAFGYTDRLFTAPVPTYRQEMQYNFPMGFLAQSDWWQRSLMTYRAVPPEEQTVQAARGEMNQWFWTYKNVKPSEPEPFAAPIADLAPRVLFSPNFEQNWVKLVNWYAEGIDQVLTLGGSERMLRGPAREAIENYEEARRADAERRAALQAALLAPPTDTLGTEEEGLLEEDDGLLEEGSEEEAAPAPAPEIELPPLTDKEKIAAIYKYVQESYESFDIPLGRDGFIPNRPVDVQGLDRIASKDLAVMLLGMLHLAGVDAKYAVVSTADHGLVRTEYPALLQFNRALVVARADGQTFFLDAGDDVAGIDDPAWSIEGRAVLLIDKIAEGGTPEWIPVPIAGSRVNTLSMLGNLEYDADAGVLRKETDVSCRGEMSRIFRDRFYARGSEAGAEGRRVWLANNFPAGSTAANWDEKRGLTNGADYQFSFDLIYPSDMWTVRGDSLILGGEIFASLHPVQEFDIGTERRNPIRLRFAARGQDETRFMIPEGYYFTSLPENLSWRSPIGSVSIEFNAWPDEIQCTLEYEIDEAEISAEQAPKLREMFDQFDRLRNARVVLIKKADVEEEGGA